MCDIYKINKTAFAYIRFKRSYKRKKYFLGF